MLGPVKTPSFKYIIILFWWQLTVIWGTEISNIVGFTKVGVDVHQIYNE